MTAMSGVIVLVTAAVNFLLCASTDGAEAGLDLDLVLCIVHKSL